MKLNRNRTIAVYICWGFLHLILFLTSGNFLSSYDSDFFPFPIFKARGVKTYSYSVYCELDDKGVGLPSYDEFFTAIQNQSKLNELSGIIKNHPELGFGIDSTIFINNMKESIEEYGKNEYHTVYGRVFPDGFEQYDYSEFIIYLLLPVVLMFVIRFWKKGNDSKLPQT